MSWEKDEGIVMEHSKTNKLQELVSTIGTSREKPKEIVNHIVRGLVNNVNSISI